MNVDLLGTEVGLEQPFILLLAIPLVLLLYLYFKRGDGERITLGKAIFLFFRFLLFFLILIAVSSPYVVIVKDEFQLMSIEILNDKSRSMELYEEQLGENFYAKLNSKTGNGSEFSLNLREFSHDGNETEIGNALYQESIKEDRDNILVLISDGNNNHGRSPVDVARILKDTSRVFALIPNSTKNEIYISDIGGERKIPVNTEYKIWVKISKLGGRAKYALNLFVDEKLVRKNEMIQDEETNTLEYVFSFVKSGVHTIKAEIIPKSEDNFEWNNRMLKVIDVVERPKVLIVSSNKNSPLIQVLGKNYLVHVTPELEANFQNYDLIILDDQPKEKLSSSVIDSLSNYLTEGNGLVVIGGENSFEYGNYENSNLERILPVISTEKPKEKRKPIAVVFLIDTSSSFLLLTLDEMKAVAINLLRQLSEDDSVGIVAFNVPAWTLFGLTEMGDNRAVMEDILLKLKATGTGGTRALPALNEAEKLLKDYEYDRYVVFLTDGNFLGEEDATIKSKAKSMGDDGIKIYAIGVGDIKYFRGAEELMQDIARESGGRYFHLGETQRLKAMFKEEEEEKEKDYYTISIYDKYHFITKDLELKNTKIKRHNGVTAKSIAQVLVSTLDNKPIVTVWRFGLGRVVTITTDNGDKWSANLYKAEDGRLISRITNWAIGDLEKRKSVRIITQDAFFGEEVPILVKSKVKPELYLEYHPPKKEGEKEKLKLKQMDVNLFSSTFTPKKEGFLILNAKSRLEEDKDAIAVNPPKEFLTLGVNKEILKKIARITNASIYDSSQEEGLIEEILKHIKEGSRKRVKVKEDIAMYFILVVLGLFFLDVVARRIKEIITLKKS